MDDQLRLPGVRLTRILDLATAHAARSPNGADRARKAAAYFADRVDQVD